jgi:hypothetical protein
MSYTTVRRGFTGPAGKIGSGTEHHQDLKLLESLPAVERVKMLDALARQNQSIGRVIEFSNPAVSGRRWNINADISDKIDLLNKAASAHAHSRHPGWQSFDYYTPFAKAPNRFAKGAVEDASIFLPVVPGGKVKSAAGGGYGYYSESFDPSGRLIARVGHGNVDRPEAEAELQIPQAPELPAAPGQQAATPGSSEQNFLLGYVLAQGLKQNNTETPEQYIQRELLSQVLAPSNKMNTFEQLLQAGFGPYSI